MVYLVIGFLATFANITFQETARLLAECLTEDEFKKRLLTSETMKSLGLKGSPKLSKVLLSFGIPKLKVDMALSGGSTSRTRVLMEKLIDLWAQGNSIHFSSCQATDPRASWSQGTEYVRIDEDEQYYGTEMFLWVAGDRMSETNSEGFLARAKLRIMYADRGCREIAGLYIDRPYGQYSLLMEEIFQLHKSWKEYSGTDTPLLMPPVWQRDNGSGTDFQSKYGGRYPRLLYCPSAEGGYQDTMNIGIGPYDFFHEVSVEDKEEDRKKPQMEAYLSRQKQATVYMTGYKDVCWNAQKWAFQSPKVRVLQQREYISDAAKKHLDIIRKTLDGFKFEGQVRSGDGGKTMNFPSNMGWVTVRKERRKPNIVVSLDHDDLMKFGMEEESLVVKGENKLLGFAPAIKLPYEWYGDELVVVRNNKEAGFQKAVYLHNRGDSDDDWDIEVSQAFDAAEFVDMLDEEWNEEWDEEN